MAKFMAQKILQWHRSDWNLFSMEFKMNIPFKAYSFAMQIILKYKCQVQELKPNGSLIHLLVIMMLHLHPKSFDFSSFLIHFQLTASISEFFFGSVRRSHILCKRNGKLKAPSKSEGKRKLLRWIYFSRITFRRGVVSLALEWKETCGDV